MWMWRKACVRSGEMEIVHTEEGKKNEREKETVGDIKS